MSIICLEFNHVFVKLKYKTKWLSFKTIKWHLNHHIIQFYSASFGWGILSIFWKFYKSYKEWMIMFFLIQTLCSVCIYFWTVDTLISGIKSHKKNLDMSTLLCASQYKSWKTSYLDLPYASKWKLYCCLSGKLWIVYRRPHSYCNILMSSWFNLSKIQNLMGNETTMGEEQLSQYSRGSTLPPWFSQRDITSDSSLLSHRNHFILCPLHSLRTCTSHLCPSL